MNDDHDLRDLLAGADEPPRPGFERELRSRLSDEWHGRAVAPVAAPRRGRPWWSIGAAAAAVVALVVTGLVWFARHDGTDRIAPPVDSLPVPATTLAPASTLPTTTPATTAAATPEPTTAPATTIAPTTTLVESPAAAPCFTGLAGPAAAQEFATAVLAARFRGAAGAPCLSAIPAEFTGEPGACWHECTPRTFPRDGIGVGEVVTSSNETFWTVTLPVTYLDPGTIWVYVDATESWWLRPDGDGWAATLSSIDPPAMTRDDSLATINDYLSALASADWEAAADYYFRDGISPEDRDDLRQLDPGEFTVSAVAAALERWCRDGCDTAPATLDDLTFTGGFALVRKGQTLRASWFEGVFGISGTPPRPFAPAAGGDLMAGWPAAPAWPTDALTEVPYFVPTVELGATGASSESSYEIPEPASFGQVFVDPFDPTVIVLVNSYPGRSAFRQSTRPVDAPGWDDPRASWSSDGYVNLSLGEPSGYLEVLARGVPEWNVLELVDGLRRRDAAPGWDVAEGSLVEVAEGWLGGYATRTIRWPNAELSVGLAGTSFFDSVRQRGETAVPIEIGGRPGLVFASDEFTAIAWQLDGGLTARFGYRGPLQAALAIVDSLTQVDRNGWLAVAPLDTSDDDGCSSLFC